MFFLRISFNLSLALRNVYLVRPGTKLQNTFLPVKWEILHIYRTRAGKGCGAEPSACAIVL